MERTARHEVVPVIVAGGITCDLAAESSSPIRRRTSNPGAARLSAGGVARNIAENIARLGGQVTLVGVVGDDPLSSWALEETAAAGVDVGCVERVPDGRVGLYLSIMDRGELDVAVSDMAAVETLEPDTLGAMLDRAVGDETASRVIETTAGDRREARSILVMDCNLSVDALQAGIDWAAARDAYVVVEPVSVEKAKRLCSVTGRIDLITPNAGELAAIAGDLFKTGEGDIQCCVVTRGKRGAALWIPGEAVARLYRTEPIRTANADGAGDAFVAGLIAGLSRGFSRSRAITLALVAGRRTASVAGTVDKHLRLDELLREISDSPEGAAGPSE